MADEKQVVQELKNSDGSHYAWMVYCPACETGHAFDKKWEFNGNMMKPTFQGSMLVDYGGAPEKKCHSYVTDGVIEFLGDCGHALKGQKVPLEAIY